MIARGLERRRVVHARPTRATGPRRDTSLGLSGERARAQTIRAKSGRETRPERRPRQLGTLNGFDHDGLRAERA